ncbi:MAG: ATP-binding cassette domain-containing protein, partial [SAR324 cluster bacterium]|nr:ATP-binding cassette domain-containing protein [SAR324 cluster bacterium]
HQIIDTLSKGYRQRVCFAQALIHDPPVLILDEPTDGLDPNQKHEMREVIRRMSRDKTIILSTHILEEMEAVCTRAIIIAQGKIVMDGTPQEMAAMSRFHKAVRVTVREPGEARLTDGFKGLNGVSEVSVSRDDDDEGMVIYHVFPEKNRPILQEVIHFLEKKKVSPESLASEPGRVDEVFRDVTQEPF